MTNQQHELIGEAQRMLGDLVDRLDINARSVSRDKIVATLRRASTRLERARLLDQSGSKAA